MFWHHSLKTVQFHCVYVIQYVHKFFIHTWLTLLVTPCPERKCIITL